MRKRKTKAILCLLTAMILALSTASCAAGEPSSPGTQDTPQAPSVPVTPDTPDTPDAPETPDAPDDSDDPQAPKTFTDPSGAEITVPEEIGTIAVLAPSLAEMVVALGQGEKISACDTSSVGLEGLREDALVLDLSNPDMEQLVALSPDLLLVTNMSLYDQEDPYKPLVDLGVCVACVPTSDSIADIMSDIGFVAELLGETERGDEIVAQMQSQVDALAAIGSTITEKKTVYFEISAAPYLYSFGSGVFLNEMIELLGAENILAAESGWLSVTEEAVVTAQPDVILTNVNYIDDPVAEIMSRPGWDAIPAVANGEVYYIDNMASSVPDQNVVKAMEEMARAIYPDYYGD